MNISISNYQSYRENYRSPLEGKHKNSTSPLKLRNEADSIKQTMKQSLEDLEKRNDPKPKGNKASSASKVKETAKTVTNEVKKAASKSKSISKSRSEKKLQKEINALSDNEKSEAVKIFVFSKTKPHFMYKSLTLKTNPSNADKKLSIPVAETVNTTKQTANTTAQAVESDVNNVPSASPGYSGASKTRKMSSSNYQSYCENYLEPLEGKHQKSAEDLSARGETSESVNTNGEKPVKEKTLNSGNLLGGNTPDDFSSLQRDLDEKTGKVPHVHTEACNRNSYSTASSASPASKVKETAKTVTNEVEKAAKAVTHEKGNWGAILALGAGISAVGASAYMLLNGKTSTGKA
jgi:hypothetical protein